MTARPRLTRPSHPTPPPDAPPPASSPDERAAVRRFVRTPLSVRRNVVMPWRAWPARVWSALDQPSDFSDARRRERVAILGVLAMSVVILAAPGVGRVIERNGRSTAHQSVKGPPPTGVAPASSPKEHGLQTRSARPSTGRYPLLGVASAPASAPTTAPTTAPASAPTTAPPTATAPASAPAPASAIPSVSSPVGWYYRIGQSLMPALWTVVPALLGWWTVRWVWIPVIARTRTAALEHVPIPSPEPRASARAGSRRPTDREGRWTRNGKTGTDLDELSPPPGARRTDAPRGAARAGGGGHDAASGHPGAGDRTGRPNPWASPAVCFARYLSGVYLYVFAMIAAGVLVELILLRLAPRATDHLRWWLWLFLFGESFFVPAVTWIRCVIGDASGRVFGARRAWLLSGYLVVFVGIPIRGMIPIVFP